MSGPLLNIGKNSVISSYIELAITNSRMIRSVQMFILHLMLIADLAKGSTEAHFLTQHKCGVRHKCCSFITNHGIGSPSISKAKKAKPHANSVNGQHHNYRYSGPLCGIKGFRSWFESTFPSSMITVDMPAVKREHKANGRSREQPTYIETDNESTLPQVYDHVLVDANQYLHSTLRRAYNRMAKKKTMNKSPDWYQGLDDETIDLSLVFLLRELDHLVTSVTIPRKSVVIALDGSPGAAKLDMQRRRRFGIYRKSEMQRKQVQVLKDRGWEDNDFGLVSAAKAVSGIENIIFAKHDREQVTLSISPGTAYMDRVTNALLYWSWKNMSKRHWPVEDVERKSSHDVKIYISPSSVPGEGEVKLLDWMMRGSNATKTQNHQSLVKMGESVAIIGGDSDLVLMGMVVPPSVTHNVNIILPRELGKTSFYLVSMWQFTKILAKYVTGEITYGNLNGKKRRKKKLQNGLTRSPITLSDMNHAKLDAVLLVIMNGNDYLPKVRGVGIGFDPFFGTYLAMTKAHWGKGLESIDSTPFIMNINDDDRLSINVPTALSFFTKMLKYQPLEFLQSMEKKNDNSQFHLGILNNLCEGKILPVPLEFTTITPGDTAYFESELWQLNSKVSGSAPGFIKEFYGEGVEIVRMTLGKYPVDEFGNAVSKNTTMLGKADGHGVISRMNTEEGKTFLFEVPHRQGGSLKSAKHRLACLALEEIFGKDNMDLFGYEDADDYDEKTEMVQADVKSYLAGLLWTLETYQKGHCADYGYNYGQRAAPAVFEIVNFLQDVVKTGNIHLHRSDLTEDTCTPPLPDGLTCLTALPSQARYLVPQPYSQLLDPLNGVAFEEMYNSCVDPKTNVFDMAKFQRLCLSSLEMIRREQKVSTSKYGYSEQNDTRVTGTNNERHIYAGSKYWTVISRSKLPLRHPFLPPEPYTARAYELRPNRKIKASKLAVAPSQRFRKTTVSTTETPGEL